MSDIAELRLSLSEWRSALKEHQAFLVYCEARVVATAVSGKNETERKANLILALGSDQAYTDALAIVRSDETAIEMLEAKIENARDERRSYEWSIRLRLVEALERQLNATNQDSAFDDVADRMVTDRSMCIGKRFLSTDELPF